MAKTNGHGPSSDGRYYNVALMGPQAATNFTGPWIVASIRGVPGSGFAVQTQKTAWEAVVEATRRLVGDDWNEAHKVMYERANQMPNHVGYDAQWGIIEGVTPIQAQE